MSADVSRPADILYYRHDGIVVTSRYFVAYHTRYDIRELSHLARSQGAAHPGVRIGLATAIAELIVIVPTLLILRSFTGFVIAVPALLIPCIASYICGRRWPAPLELIAQHRGNDETLYTTHSEHHFGQVSRALIRAIESAR